MTRSYKNHTLSPKSSHTTSLNVLKQTTEKIKLVTRKKSSYKHVPHSMKPAHLVAKRNARERLRVQAVKSAFIQLSKHVPSDSRHKKLSKLKTLRLAISYINNLRELIHNHDQHFTKGQSSSDISGNTKKSFNTGMIKDCEQCQADSQLGDIRLIERNHNLYGQEINSKDVRYTSTIRTGPGERITQDLDVGLTNLHQGSSRNFENMTHVNWRNSLNQNFNDYQISEQMCPIARPATAQTCSPNLELFEDNSELMYSAFDPRVSEINSLFGMKMHTHCYLTKNNHIFSHSFLSSCVPRFITDETIHF
ncbi:achaete-scute 1a [Biomphalaria glabrata]|nr:achaete-scute-like protein 1a-like [Biomphalaria glabrata]